MFFSLFTLFLFTLVSAQEIGINGTAGNRPLEWSDFKGRPDGSSAYHANNRWNIDFKLPTIRTKPTDSVSLSGAVVKLELDTERSWVKEGKQTAGLLKHEQGHFDIGRLCQLELVAALRNLKVLPAEIQSKIGGLFTTIMEKYKRLGTQYDAETAHSVNRPEQEKWDNFLQQELVRLGNSN